MRHVFILNSYGKRDHREIINEIFKYCVNHNMDYKIEVNSDKQSTEDIVKKYSDKNNVIYAVGGDGMINKVLNQVVKTDATLSYLPYGTGNDLARVLGTYPNGVRDVNVGKINDKYFINVACFGVDADISNDERFIHNIFIPRSQRYNVGAVYHFITYKPKELEIYYNDNGYNNDIYGKFATVAVCNSKYYGGGYEIAPNAKVDDDLFDVYLVDDMNRIRLARTILKMKNGKHEGMNGVERREMDNITIRSRNAIKANIDGEVLESDEFNISLANNVKVYNNTDMIKELDDVLHPENVKKRILKR